MQLTESQRAFLSDVHYAVVGTLHSDGSIQQTVIWYILEGDQLRFSASASSVKIRNLRRNPQLSVTIEAAQRYLTLSGTATIDPMDPDLRYRLAVRYLGADKAEEWAARRPDIERVSVRMTIQRVYGQGV